MEIDIRNLDGVKEYLNKFPRLTEQALNKVIKQGLSDIVERAGKHHRFTSRSGALVNSIKSDYNPSTMVGRVYLDKSVAPYGYYIHNGTKQRNTPITPKNKRVLRWVSNGSFVYAKKSNPKPIKADKFLYQAGDYVRPKFSKMVAEEIAKVVNGR